MSPLSRNSRPSRALLGLAFAGALLGCQSPGRLPGGTDGHFLLPLARPDAKTETPGRPGLRSARLPSGPSRTSHDRTGLPLESAGEEAEPTAMPSKTFRFSDDSTLRLDAQDGLIYEGTDGLPRLDAGGVLALQFIKYDPRNSRHSGARADRAVARLDGDITEELRLRLGVDLSGTDTRGGFEEGWLSYERKGWPRASAGLLRVPLGHEFSVPQEQLSLVGWGFPTYLDARTDLAVRLDGEIADSILYYDLVAAAGEGFDPYGQKRDGSQLSARVISYPFRRLTPSVSFLHYDVPLLSGIFGGAALAYSPDYRGHLDVGTPLGNKLFVTPSLRADGSLFVHYTAGADLGPFRATYELVEGSLFDLKTATGKEDLRRQITSWAATFSWMLTGEHYDSRPMQLQRGGQRLEPKRAVWGVPRRGFGALELATRYSNADIDRDFFRLGVTDYVHSSQEFRTFTGALNWYANPNLKVSFALTRTIADQDPKTFDGQGRDTSYVVQLQYVF